MRQFMIVFVAVLTASALSLSIAGAGAYTYIQQTSDRGTKQQLIKVNKQLQKISQKLGGCTILVDGEAFHNNDVCGYLKKIADNTK